MANQFQEVLKLDDFKKLLNCLEIASKYLDDIDMKAGKIRQLTTDKATTINMDLSSIYKSDLCVADIKSKLSLLNLIVDDGDETVTINVMDKFWFVYNTKTVFKFAWASAERLSTSFLIDQHYQDRFIANSTPENLLHSLDMVARSDIHKKISKITDTFNSDKIVLDIGEKAISISIHAEDKKNTSTIFKVANPGIPNNYEIAIRSNFIDRLDSKMLKNVSFFGESNFQNDISIARAECSYENIEFTVHTFAKCKKTTR